MPSLTQREIEQDLIQQTEDESMFFSHAPDLSQGKILWQDKDTGDWCVNQYIVNDRTVHMGSMPIEMFTAAI